MITLKACKPSKVSTLALAKAIKVFLKIDLSEAKKYIDTLFEVGSVVLPLESYHEFEEKLKGIGEFTIEPVYEEDTVLIRKAVISRKLVGKLDVSGISKNHALIKEATRKFVDQLEKNPRLKEIKMFQVRKVDDIFSYYVEYINLI